MSFQRRTAKNGDVTRVVNITIPLEVYEQCFGLSVKERVRINKVVRAALLVGASKMRGEYARMERGEENKVDKLREMYRRGERVTVKSGEVNRLVSVTIPEEVYDKLHGVSIADRVTLNKVVRVAVLVGASKVKSEYARMERGEANKVDKLRAMYRQDGRMGKLPNVAE